ncbi:MAG: hypothetical protein RBR54_06110 [Sulfurimonas sp.]|jgi:hypothetical protein|nr:hypothetical protein [Sulfurimonas sp.]
MINLLIGLQGSGKSYYAVAEIWKHIKKMNQAEISGTTYKYKKIYTNIEGFVPNRFVEILDVQRLYKIWEWELKQYKAYEDRYEYKTPKDIEFETKKITTSQEHLGNDNLDIDLQEKRIEESTLDSIEIFENNDQKLYESIRDPNATVDPEFIKYTLPYFEKQGFTNCLIVIDEAHNFFGGALKPPLRRLLSYHRHYHDQDYLLISQDLKMFNFAVCQLTAYTIRAINPIMRWRSDIFTYNIYSGGWISFSGDNKLETKSLKAKELIFNLYNSGGKVLQKSHFLKVVLKILGLIGGVIVFGYFSLQSFTHQDEVKVVDKNTTKKVVQVQKEKILKQDLKTSIEVFTLVGKNLIHDKSSRKFSYDNFETFLSTNDKPINYIKNMDNTAKIYYELTDETVQKLNIKVHDAKKLHYYNPSFSQ